MKAFVLAGGLGTRLQPRFGALPKPLAPIGGKPFVTRQLEWLAAHGLHRAVVLAGHGADALRAALGTRAAGGELEWSVEEEPVGPGGALRGRTRAGGERRHAGRGRSVGAGARPLGARRAGGGGALRGA